MLGKCHGCGGPYFLYCGGNPLPCPSLPHTCLRMSPAAARLADVTAHALSTSSLGAGAGAAVGVSATGVPWGRPSPAWLLLPRCVGVGEGREEEEEEEVKGEEEGEREGREELRVDGEASVGRVVVVAELGAGCDELSDSCPSAPSAPLRLPPPREDLFLAAASTLR